MYFWHLLLSIWFTVKPFENKNKQMQNEIAEFFSLTRLEGRRREASGCCIQADNWPSALQVVFKHSWYISHFLITSIKYHGQGHGPGHGRKPLF